MNDILIIDDLKEEKETKKFPKEIRENLKKYLSIENENKKDIQDAIDYLEKYFYQSTVNWHDDNFFYDYNYGLLFGLCGLNGKQQEEIRKMFEDFYNVSIF